MTAPFVTPAEAAERLGLHPETVRAAIRRGAMPAVRVLGRWRVRADDLDRIAAGERPSPTLGEGNDRPDPAT